MTEKLNFRDSAPETSINYIKRVILEYIYGESAYINPEALKKGIFLEFESWKEQHTYLSGEIEAAQMYFEEFEKKHWKLLKEYGINNKKLADEER